MAKTLAAIEQGLAEVYSGPTYEKNGFTYIPWNEAAKVANRVFGIDGYAVDVLKVEHMGQGYMAHVRVTVFPTDGKPFYRDGIGYNELTGDNGRAHDTAIKGAPSDGFNRALKLFGEAFGLALYDKSETSSTRSAQSGNSGNARPNTQSTDTKASVPPSTGQRVPNDKRPSEKQMAVLEKNGYSKQQVGGMSFSQWKSVIDDLFAKKTPAIAPAPKAIEAVDNLNLQDDDIPF